MKENMKIFNSIAAKIALSNNLLHHFQQFGMKEDAEYYQGRLDALIEMATSFGFDVNEVLEAAKGINVQDFELQGYGRFL